MVQHVGLRRRVDATFDAALVQAETGEADLHLDRSLAGVFR
jgi:hypothetical protein